MNTYKGRNSRSVSIDGLALFINQELCEVPLDEINSKGSSLFGLQVFPQRVCIVTIDQGLFVDIKLDFLFPHELLQVHSRS